MYGASHAGYFDLARNFYENVCEYESVWAAFDIPAWSPKQAGAERQRFIEGPIMSNNISGKWLFQNHRES